MTPGEHLNAATLDETARTLPIEDLAEFIGACARAQAFAIARLSSPRDLAKPLDVAIEGPVLITVEEAAKLVGLTPTALRRSGRFRHAKRKLGHRTVMFDRAALLKAARRAS
jgi:hypothetical protein